MAEDKIVIANDHGGYRLKCRLLEYFRENGIPYEDLGCDSEDIVRYPYYAARVAQAISEGSARRGILICSTGIGMSIVANRYKGVRASLCTSVTEAVLTRAHNDSNLLCLGGRVIGEFVALDILKAWLETEFMGGRHNISLGLLAEAENTLSTGREWVPENPDL